MSIADLGQVSSAVTNLLSRKSLFALWVADAPLQVVRFTGREAISSPFEFRIEVASEGQDVEALVGQSARFHIFSGESPRVVHGVVCEVNYVGYTRSCDLYEVTIAPWAHYLHHRVGVRLFQDMTTEQIITDVLTKAGLARAWWRFALVENYSPRNYCVQYRETDFAFVSRLLEEDGIFYFFEHEDDKHVWVMADHAGAHPSMSGSPTIWFCPPLGSMVQDREQIQRFRFGRRTCSGKVTLRDFNLHKPDEKLEVSKSAAVDANLESYDYPGEYQTLGQAGPHQGEAIARIRLEAFQANRRGGGGESDCPRFVAGYVMNLAGHPRADLNGQYRLTAVTHMGTQPILLDQAVVEASSYKNTFTCTEYGVPFRPRRVTPRPVVGGLQTATVVGPEGEEVHTDEHGRVRVQFHWDREGSHDDTSTCWIRVSQMWAGNGWGAQFLPRIGHEVLVDFLEGDPDRPVITGRIYQGFHPHPYPLPENKTRSGIKTESSPGGGGSNELHFEDAKGSEEVYLHAQKNLTEKVENDHSDSVGSNQSISVGANQSTSVGANQSTSVGANQSNSVGGNQANSVTGNQTESVGGEQTMTVTRDRKVTVTGSESVQVMAGATLDITGSYKVDASDKIDIQAPSHIKITCGGSTITIEPDKITLSAGGEAKLVLDVDALLKSAAGSKVKLDADATTKASTGATVKLDANVLAEAKPGSKVLLDANATMSSPGVASVQGPTAVLAGGSGMVEASGAGLTCAGSQVNVSGGMVNIAGGMVKIN